MRPVTRQRAAIDFLVEHLTLFEEMIEKYRATVCR
jgi:hypothetical protein